jgi:flavin reductase (DIM6/NTAB) family NADH-FMN oxidoreductase RutF/DNA-binding IclR family transcriptional regulator
MRLHLTQDLSVEVVDADDCTALSVTAELPAHAAAEVLVDAGIATAGEDAAVWLDIDELRMRAAPGGSDGWHQRYAAMIEYARGKGWLDEDAHSVRAHIATAENVTPRAFDSRRLRDVLGHFATGVTIVTAIDAAGEPTGFAVGSFTSVSLDPPLVAFLPARTSTTFPKVREAASFCVNVLGSDQEEVCRLFATRGADKFSKLKWEPAPSGAPVLEGATAWLDCTIETIHEAGDHLIVVGRVRDLDIVHAGPPLVFLRGGYGRFEPASLVAVPEHDIIEQVRVAGLARPALEGLARELDVEAFVAGAVRDKVVLLASADPARPRYVKSRVGNRSPHIAPVWSIFVAWEDPKVVGRWLSGSAFAERSVDPVLARVRERGWSVALGNDAYDQLETAIVETTRRGDNPEVQRSVKSVMAALSWECFDSDIVPGEEYDLRLLNAPVFDPRGRVALGLGLRGFGGRVSGREVRGVARLLVREAEAMTARIGGRRPA